MTNQEERLIIALDVESRGEVSQICKVIGDRAVFYKVGLQLFLAEGQYVIDLLKSHGAKVFLDLKLHDIPNQVAGAGREIVKMGVDMMTVHTMGGADMMRSVALAVGQASQELGVRPPVLLGVTVLTSLNQAKVGEVGIVRLIKEQVVSLAALAKKSGLDGVVASPHEVRSIRNALGNDLVIVTPGIRSVSDDVQDQSRVMSAYDAIKAGSSYLVVGRPILKAKDPAVAAARIIEEIEKANV